MKPRKFEERLPKNIPDPQEVLGEGKDAGKELAIGETLFFKKKQVKSELEFKKRAIKEGEITYHGHIGLSSWQKTRRGFETIYKLLKERKGKLDRFGICLDRSMGYPSHMREKVGKGTGLVLRNRDEWLEVGQVVPIQPHFGDHMLGSPAAFENTLLALECGATTIGNVSQYFNLAYTEWKDEVAIAVETVKAIGTLAALKPKGTLVHSNLDDGFGSQFRDLTSLLGWSLFEKYLVEELMGAKITFCFGHVHSSVRRIAFLQALNQAYGEDFIGSMIYGLTSKYVEDIDRNFATVASYLVYDIAAQLKTPTGHAITPIPVTEAIRIPLPEEIAQIQLVAHQLEQAAADLCMLLDWDVIRQVKHHILIGGRIFFHLLKTWLRNSGVDLSNPIELLLSLKQLGARNIETSVKKFAGLEDKLGKETILVPTDPWREQKHLHQEVGQKITRMTSLTLKGKKGIVAATDVHEYGKELVKAVLLHLGGTVKDVGVVVDPVTLSEVVGNEKPHFLAISTYNGVALSYSKQLLTSLNLVVPIFMGGKLNEHLGGELAQDVTKDLEDLGIIPCTDIYEFPRLLEQTLSKRPCSQMPSEKTC